MNELLIGIAGGCIGAAVAIIAHKHAMIQYFSMVEAVWNHDVKRLNARIDDLMIDKMKDNVVYFSTKSVDKY